MRNQLLSLRSSPFSAALWVVAFWSFGQSAAVAQLPTASLRTVWPCSVQAGTAADLVVAGDFLDEAEELIFSDPRITAQVKAGSPLPGSSEPSKQYGRFTVQVPAEVPTGLVDVRVRGRYGLSNPRRLTVESVPVAKVEEARFTPEQAKEVTLDRVWLGRTTASQIDHYKFALEAGSLIRVHCDALLIDSMLVPTLILCDGQQREIVRARGTKAADAMFVYTVEATGTYYLKVRDALFRGGGNHFYRLRVETEAGSGKVDRAVDKRIAEQPQEDMSEYLTTAESVRRLAESELDVSNSIELTPPERVLARFPETGIPTASFDFEAKAGEKWMIEVASAATGAATDPEMQIGRLRKQGDNGFQFQRLHHIDDLSMLPGSLLGSTTKDPVHLFQVPEDGRYRVILRDLQTTSNETWNKSFLFSIRPAEPDFELFGLIPHVTLDPARSAPMGTLLRRGGKLAVEVAIEPEDGFFGPVKAEASVAGGQLTLTQTINWAWPVTVTAEGLPPGLNCTTLKLDNAKRRGYLILEAADDVGAWVGPLQIAGSVQIPAEYGGQQLKRSIRPVTIQLPDPDGRGRAVVRSCDDLRLAITDLESAPLQVTLGGETPEFTVKAGTDVEIPLSIQRSDHAKAKVTLRAVGLPPNAKAGEVNLEGETLSANMKLTVPANVPVGDYQLFVNGETEVSWPRNPQALFRAEQRLEALKAQLAAAEEAQKEGLTKQVSETEAQVNQLRESTKPQPTRTFVPSNPVTVHVAAAE